MTAPPELEPEIRRIGGEIAKAFPGSALHPFKALDDKAMDLASRDAELRAALFRFVDVVPACHSLEDLTRHLTAFLDDVTEQPPPIAVAMRMSHTKAGRTALGAAAAAGVRHLAHRFIVGETPKDALPDLRGLWKDGAATTVDLLGEATITTAEADRYAARCHETLEVLAQAAPSWSARPALEHDGVGPMPRVNLSVKVSALTPLLRPDAPELGKRDAAGRLRELLRRARDLNAHLHIDMESLDSRQAVFELILELLGEAEFAEGPSSGVVLQAYLRDSPELLDRILSWAAATPRAHPLVVRLVKGAYWDHEVVEAHRHGWAPPVFEEKADSDRNFEALTRRLLDARPAVRVAIASHNLRSVAHAIAYNRLSGGADEDLELQVLRGLGDDLQHALASTGPAGAHLLPGRGPGGGHGLPRPPPAREHEQRVLPQRAGARRAARGAAGGAVSEANERREERSVPMCELRAVRARSASPSATSRSSSSGARPCARSSKARCGRSTRRSRPGASRSGSGRTAAATATSPRPTPGSPSASSPPRARREPPRSTPRSPAPGTAAAPGPRRRPASARRPCSAPPTSSAAAASSSPPSRCASAASRGARRTPTCARRSTSSSTTRAAPSRSTRARRSSRSPASATPCATARAA